MITRKQLRAAIAGVAVCVTAVVLFVATGSTDPDADPDADPFAGVPRADDNPGLSGAEERAARRIISQDEVVLDLLDGAEPKLTKIGPWGERDTEGIRRAVGAVAIVDLGEPRDFEAREWPTVDYEPGEDPCSDGGVHYSEVAYAYAVVGARRVMVDVDLNMGRVVGFSFSSGEIIPVDPPEPRESCGR